MDKSLERKLEKMLKKQNSKGITLVSLIITIIIMLILAGVGVSAIINDGLITSTTTAQQEYKKESMIEAIRTAETYLEANNMFDYSKKITVERLIEKLKDISDINEENYVIIKDEDNQLASIVDVTNRIVVDIVIDSNGNVTVEGNIIDIDNEKPPLVTIESSNVE